jgi:haloalkane dehalogenase
MTVLSPAVQALYPFASRFLDRNGFRYHYVDEGQGEAVVMVHGNPTWSFYYRNLITGLSSEYRTLAVDHIGCGLSDKPSPQQYDYRFHSRVADFTAFMDQTLPAEKITLVVHDWGGAIGLAWAVNHPDRVGRLVVLNTSGFFPPKEKGIPWQLWVVRNLTPLAVPAVLGLNLFAQGAAFMAAYKKLSPEARAGLVAPYDSWARRIATLRFVQDIPVKPGDPSYDAVAHVQNNLSRLADAPMLLIWGRHDFVFDSWYYEEWRRRFPKAEAHMLNQAGHYVLEDEPLTCLVLIRNFLAAHPLGSER